MNSKTKLNNTLETKLYKIKQRSSKNENFSHLIELFNVENLKCCFHELDGNKAVGIDNKTKEEYGKNLEINLINLVSRMKQLNYKPQIVKEVLIPKANGKKRPLGISCFEDKIIQLLYAKILEAIYDVHFFDFSYGFRKNKSAHQAIKKITNWTFKENTKAVIDVDLENYFGSIPQEKLVTLLEMKIKDKIFIRYLKRMFKTGISREGEIVYNKIGTVQGSIVSPVLANIYGHYAFDLWFKEMVNPRLKGKATLIRFCDDMVILCTSLEDVKRIAKSLKGRCQRFSLGLNVEKSKLIKFDKREATKGIKQQTFNFLGFTFYYDRSLQKKIIIPKVRTSKKSFNSKLKELANWCKKNRSKCKLVELWKEFNTKVLGHVNYFSVSNNSYKIKDFIYKSEKIFFKWINRRSQKKSFSWVKFGKFLKVYPSPRANIKFSLF